MRRKVSVTIAIMLALCLVSGCGSNAATSAEAESEAAESTFSDAGSVDEEVAEESTKEEAEQEAENEQATEEPEIEIDLVGTRWKDDDSEYYYHFEEDGKLTGESVAVSTSTSTINGSTSTHTSKSLMTQSFTWERIGNVVRVNNSFELTIKQEDDVLKLIGKNATYTYTEEDPLGDTGEEDASTETIDAEPYEINNAIMTDTIEMNFFEKGISEDIRITSEESGISITSGPSPESGKKFIFLKGKVKNLNTSAININMTGIFTIDGYTFDMKVHSANAAGSPFTTIDPLDELTLILYAPVSNELIDSFNEAELIFGFNDNFEIVRSLDEAGHSYKVSF